jgi:4-hydroxy-2-oxoheptanedioate aldolase
MTNNFIREKILAGKSVSGIWSIIPSPTLTEIIALAGLDFQIFDMEHGAYNFSNLESAIRTCDQMKCSPFVRIGSLDLSSTQRALDLGAHGVIYPQIASFEEARQAVRLCNYPPLGQRGFNPFTRVSRYGLKSEEKNCNQNGFSMAGVIIENISAYAEMDRILELPELEIVYLGAYDMSVALGCPGDIENPKVVKFIESGILNIRKANKIAGVMVKSPRQIKSMINLGANFIVVGVESHLIGQCFSQLQHEFSGKI